MKLLPENTLKYCHLASRSLMIIRHEGWRSFYHKAGLYIKTSYHGAKRSSLYRNKARHILLEYGKHTRTGTLLKLVPPQPQRIVAAEDDTVSIIIPVKNAGGRFGHSLQALKNQKGLKNVELIVVDSGSTDESISTAFASGSRVIHIQPAEFSHSYARNLGAEAATGKYLFFTTQDAFPSSDLFIYKLLSALKHNHAAAVSCAEFPREDSDLFYRAITWFHYEKYLGLEQGDRTASLPADTSMESLRKNSQLSDIAMLIQGDLFRRYQYHLDYAEDLDLGMRMIKDGHKLALLNSVGIIHSHNRTAFYWLKRGYVDVGAQAGLCNDANRFLVDLPSLYPH